MGHAGLARPNPTVAPMPWRHANPAVLDWPALRALLHQIGESDRLACRGQAGDYGEGTIYSTLDRALMQSGIRAELAATVERLAIQRFYQLAPNYLSPSELLHLREGPSLLMLMRHYRSPTRLVDWTESIWIAAFAAAGGDWEQDGIIFVFDRQLFDERVQDRFAAQAAQATRTADWNGTPMPAVALYELDAWVCRLVGLGPRIPRVIAQQSMFTIGSRLGLDHGAEIDRILPDTDSGQATKQVIRIPRDLKPKIMKELSRMGITANSLFPGIDGIGQSLQAFAHYAALDDAVQLLARSGGGRLQPAPKS
jgi:hypothetical protein